MLTEPGPALAVIGEAAAHEGLAWFESKPLFGWRVLVPRTKEQAASLSERLRSYGAVPQEVPTIAVEPPRTPQQMERAVKGLVTGRYQWIAFTSVNAVRAVREKLEEYGLDARAFAGVKVAAVGEQTAAALGRFGIKPDLVPEGEQSSEGLAAAWPPYDDVLDPINRVLLPRADIATEALVARLTELGWEAEDVTAYRTVRAAPPPAPIREAIKGGGFDAVLFTSSSTVRNLIGHRRQAACGHGHRGDRPADRADRRRVRPAGGRDGAEAVGHRPWPKALAEHGASLREAAIAAGEPVRKPSERRRGAPPPAAVTPPASSRKEPAVNGGFPAARPRRLRRTAALRRLAARTTVHGSDLVLPLFVKEGISEPEPVPSMPGVAQHTRDSLRKTAAEAVAAGVGGLMLFGIPAVKDARGSAADDPDGIVQQALADLAAEVGDATVLMADLCLCEYTDHGHCGPLTAAGEVDNDATLERYASIAVAQAAAGAHVVGPSGMMDGQVGVIRQALDRAGLPGGRHLRLLGQVRLRLLRAVPGRGRVRAAVRRPVRLPAGPGRRGRGAGDPARRGRGRRHRDGQARAAVPGCDRPGRRGRPGARGRLPGQRGVRDGGGGGRERLAGPGPGDHGDPDRDPPRRRQHHPHLLGRRSRPQARLATARLAGWHPVDRGTKTHKTLICRHKGQPGASVRYRLGLKLGQRPARRADNRHHREGTPIPLGERELGADSRGDAASRPPPDRRPAGRCRRGLRHRGLAGLPGHTSA
jgi:uroporphyrinogen-III synthase